MLSPHIDCIMSISLITVTISMHLFQYDPVCICSGSFPVNYSTSVLINIQYYASAACYCRVCNSNAQALHLIATDI